MNMSQGIALSFDLFFKALKLTNHFFFLHFLSFKQILPYMYDIYEKKMLIKSPASGSIGLTQRRFVNPIGGRKSWAQPNSLAGHGPLVTWSPKLELDLLMIMTHAKFNEIDII